MSTSVESKIVSVYFDNASFEKNIAATIASLGKLKTSIEGTNIKSGLNDLNTASQGINLNPVAAAVDGISAKFLALSTIAITVLSNIVNKAVDTGIALAKSMTLQPLMEGFQEYETNIKSIQTILANTSADGTDLKDVTAALDELNTYADQTIYNFSEMARNIGTFTAAGVDLDTATGAIKGIANLAAISGSNSQQASNAMYQLSQAISTGTLKLIDWNSVVNAGMGGEVFQKALFESGKALQTIKGVAIDTTFEEWTSAGNSFRASLEQGWLTGEVLTNTLADFTGDLSEAQILSMGYTREQAAEIMKMGEIGQDAATKVKTLTQLIQTVKEAISSGWSKSFQIIFGDFNEAKELFTGISEAVGVMVGDSADARNNMLESWKQMGGRTLLIQGLKDAFIGLASIFEPIRNAFRDIFPKTTVKDLLVLTTKFASFTKSLKISGYTAFKLHAIFKGFFSILEIGWEVIKNAGRAVSELFSYFTDGGDGILSLGEKFGTFFSDLNDRLVEGGGITAFFDGLIEAVKDPAVFIDKLKAKFKAFFEGIDFGSIEGVFEAITRIKDSIIEAISGFDLGIFEGVKDFFDGMFDNFDPELTNSMEGGFGRLGEKLQWLGKIFSKAGDILSSVGDVFGWFWDKTIGVKDAVVGAIGNIGDAFVGFGPALVDFFKSDDFDKVIELAKVAVGGKFAGVFSKIATDGLSLDFTGGTLTGLSDVFRGFSGTGQAVNNTLSSLSGTLTAMQTNLKADTLLKIAGAIALLTASVVVLSMIDTEALVKAMSALAVGFGQLIGSFAILNSIAAGPAGAAKFAIISAGLLLITGALLVMAIAVKILSTMSWEELGKGLSSIIVLLAALTIAVNNMPESGKMISTGLGIIAIAVGINILAVAMKIFATMSWEDISKGLVSVAGGLGIMVAAMNLLPDNMVAKGAGILFVSVALNFLAAAMKVFATMSWEEIGKGLAAVAGGLLIIAGAMQLMPVSMVLTGPALIAIAFALNILAGALMLFATMSWGEFGKAIAVMAASLAVLAIAVNLMSGAVGGAIAIGIVSVSLGLLVKVLQQLGGMKLKDIGKGLLGLAGVLTVLGLATLVLTPILPAMFVLGLALLAIGAGLALFGLGASLAAGALTVLLEAGTAGIDVLLLLIDQLIMRIPDLAGALVDGFLVVIQSLLDQAPTMIDSLLEIIGQILQGIIDLSPKFAETLIALIDVGLTAITEKGPDIIAAGLGLLLSLLEGISNNIGEITTTVADIIIKFLEALTEKIPDLVAAGANLLVEFLNGIADNIATVAAAAADVIVEFINGITNNIASIITAGTDLIIEFISGITKATVDIIAAGTDLITDFITGIGNAASDIVTAGVDTVLAFLEGVADNALELANGAADVIIQFLNGIASTIEEKSGEFRAAGLRIAGAIMDGVLFGLPGKVKDAFGWGSDVAGGIVDGFTNELKIKSPSRIMMGIGTNIMLGLVAGMNDNANKPINSVTKITSNVVRAINTTLDSISLSDLDIFEPTIRPVLDLSNVTTASKDLSKILNASSMTPSLSLDQANLISSIAAANQEVQTEQTATQARDVMFEQNIYSPEPLSATSIYRNTRSQIVMAKQELSIP